MMLFWLYIHNYLRAMSLLTVAVGLRISAFIRCCARRGFVLADLLVFEERCCLANETVFRSITCIHSHELFRLLPPQSTAS